MSDSLTSYTYKMVQQVQEEADRFIFETIQPFCEEVTQMKIEKRDLEQALLKTKARKIAVISGRDCCPVCMNPLEVIAYCGRRECYCIDCGQKLLR